MLLGQRAFFLPFRRAYAPAPVQTDDAHCIWCCRGSPTQLALGYIATFVILMFFTMFRPLLSPNLMKLQIFAFIVQVIVIRIWLIRVACTNAHLWKHACTHTHTHMHMHVHVHMHTDTHAHTRL